MIIVEAGVSKAQSKFKGHVVRVESTVGNEKYLWVKRIWDTPYLCKGIESPDRVINVGDYIELVGVWKDGPDSTYRHEGQYFKFDSYEILPLPENQPATEQTLPDHEPAKKEDPYQFTSIIDGQFEVSLNPSFWSHDYDRTQFMHEINLIRSKDPHFAKICHVDGHSIRYKSEALFPKNDVRKKKKILIILGNPATHSVTGGMFFFSRRDGNRHQFWGKLTDAGLMPKIAYSDLKEEAKERKNLILSGSSSSDYLLGLSTFYSFPTPVHGIYQDSKGVEVLFKPVLHKLQMMELQRNMSYPFAKDALWIFTQQSSFKFVLSSHQIARMEYWPLRGRGSSGKNLSEIIRKMTVDYVDA